MDWKCKFVFPKATESAGQSFAETASFISKWAAKESTGRVFLVSLRPWTGYCQFSHCLSESSSILVESFKASALQSRPMRLAKQLLLRSELLEQFCTDPGHGTFARRSLPSTCHAEANYNGGVDKA